jgi:membrane-associated phospholipid phosphatase
MNWQASWRVKPLSSFFAFQLNVILRLQHALVSIPLVGPYVKKVVALTSVFGAGAPAFLSCTIVMWCVDVRAGFVGHAVLASAVAVGGMLKNILRQPRPFYVSDKVIHLDPTTEMSFGCPSGHTIVVFGVYPSMALVYGDPRLLSAAWLLAICVALSRMVSGAHFLHDVLAGAAIAGIAYACVVWSTRWLLSVPLHVCLSALSLFFATRVRNTTNRVETKLVKEGIESAGMCAGLAVALLLFGQPSALAELGVSLMRPAQAIAGLVLVLLVSKLPKPTDSDGCATVAGTAAMAAIIMLLELVVIWIVPTRIGSLN